MSLLEPMCSPKTPKHQNPTPKPLSEICAASTVSVPPCTLEFHTTQQRQDRPPQLEGNTAGDLWQSGSLQELLLHNPPSNQGSGHSSMLPTLQATSAPAEQESAGASAVLHNPY